MDLQVNFTHTILQIGILLWIAWVGIPSKSRMQTPDTVRGLHAQYNRRCAHRDDSDRISTPPPLLTLLGFISILCWLKSPGSVGSKPTYISIRDFRAFQMICVYLISTIIVIGMACSLQMHRMNESFFASWWDNTTMFPWQISFRLPIGIVWLMVMQLGGKTIIVIGLKNMSTLLYAIHS